MAGRWGTCRRQIKAESKAPAQVRGLDRMPVGRGRTSVGQRCPAALVAMMDIFPAYADECGSRVWTLNSGNVACVIEELNFKFMKMKQNLSSCSRIWLVTTILDSSAVKRFSHIVHPLKERTLLYLTTSELCQLYLNKAGGQQVNYGEAPEPSHPSAEHSLESVCFKGNENGAELQALLPYAHNLNSSPSDTVGENWRWPKVKVKRPELQSWPFWACNLEQGPSSLNHRASHHQRKAVETGTLKGPLCESMNIQATSSKLNFCAQMTPSKKWRDKTQKGRKMFAYIW